jgi:hypothetical protein
MTRRVASVAPRPRATCERADGCPQPPSHTGDCGHTRIRILAACALSHHATRTLKTRTLATRSGLAVAGMERALVPGSPDGSVREALCVLTWLHADIRGEPYPNTVPGRPRSFEELRGAWLGWGAPTSAIPPGSYDAAELLRLARELDVPGTPAGRRDRFSVIRAYPVLNDAGRVVMTHIAAPPEQHHVRRDMPTPEDAERAYRNALAAELAAVDKLNDRSSSVAITHARELADKTNAALRTWQAAKGAG